MKKRFLFCGFFFLERKHCYYLSEAAHLLNGSFTISEVLNSASVFDKLKFMAQMKPTRKPAGGSV